MRRTLGVMVALLLAPAMAWAAPSGYIGGQYRYWAFSDHNDLRDVLAYWVPGPLHVQVEVWDFVNPESEDQFRPEVGIHLRDKRRSVYTFQWRSEGHQERFWFMTDQVVGAHWVARAEISPILSDSTEWVVAGGADYYWGSWNFASATAIRDPRGEQGQLWVFPMRVRLANERNDWVQATLAPATQRTIGWALDLKKSWVRLGIEQNNRYDFTNIDNVIYTVGFEVPLGSSD